jgi:hypothetical protein
VCLSISYCAGAQDKRPSEAVRTVSNTKADKVADRARVLGEYGELPLSFEANQGQSDGSVRFLSRGNGYTLLLTSTGAVMAVSQPYRKARDLHNPGAGQSTNEISPIEMEFLGANPRAEISGVEELRGKTNYFIGKDPKKWHTGIPTYAKVSYKNIYPGIDLVYYGNQRQLEYDFVVAPGADPKAIRLKMAGVGKMRRDQHGDLVVRVGATILRLTAPKVYQEDVERHEVGGRWLRRSGHELQFAIGPYDKTKTLVIDPAALVYSTYLGGSLTDVATGIAVDSSGDAYITGYTASGGTQAAVPFPTTSGAYQTQCNGCTSLTGTNNAFITELDPTGSVLIYSTFLGGNNGDSTNGIAIDASGNAYVVGTTFSSDFPVTPNAFQPACAGSCTKGDAFVTELDPEGQALVFSTFLGGTGADKGLAIAVGTPGGIYVTGSTTSTDFPTQNPFQPSCSGGCTDSDAFITEVNTGGGSLAYSTYLGGTGTDKGNGIAVDGSGDAFVVGSTGSSNFPVSSPYQSTCGGCANGLTAAFVTMFDPAGTALTYSTFLSGTQYPSGAAGDSAFSVALDAAGDAYVAGSTTSTNFPTVNAFQSSCAGGCSASDAFVTEFNPSGSALNYSTYLGGSGADQAFGIAVDSVGNAFVTGQTSSIDFPTPNQNYVFQSGCKGCPNGHDAFVAEVSVPGNGLVFSSYLGGTTSQTGAGIAVNTAANGTNTGDQAVIVGWTTSSNFPVTTGSFQGTFGGVEDAFISQFPDVANCTTTHTLSGFTVNATVTCTGNFVSGNQNQFVGFVWGDGATDGFPGCTSPCQVSSGTVSLSVSHTYSTGSYTAAPTVNDASGASIVTVGFSVSVPPLAITTQPASQTIDSGQTATLSVVATGAPPLSYQWYQGVSGNTSSPIAGAANSTYTTPALTATTSYWVQVTNSSGFVKSSTATITVKAIPPTITTQPASQTINSGQTATLSVVASGTPSPTYQWYQGASGDLSSPITGAINSSYTTPALIATTSYWVQAVNVAGKANSNTATITVNPIAPTITTQPASQTISSGQTATLSVVASGTPAPTYQWYQGTSGTLTSPIAGAVNSSYTTPALTVTTSYWVQAVNVAGKANSNTATITVTAPVVVAAATLPGGTIGTAYTQTTLGASGGTPPYAWALAQGSQPLPPGITLSTTGALSGTPVAAGIFNFTVQATDSKGLAASQGFSITVVPPAGAPTCLAPTLQANSNTNPLAVTATSNCTDSSGTIASTTINWGDGSAPSSGSPSSHTYAAQGTYSITVTAADTNVPSLSDSASGSVTLTAPVETPVTQGQSAQQNTNVTAPLGVPSVQVTYQCSSVNGPSGVQTMAYYNLSCTINSGGASATVTLTSTPTPIQITVQTNSAAAELRRPGLRGIGSGPLYAAFLPLPGIALLGIGWSSKRRRKAGRYVGLALLGGLMLICVACGGGSSSTTTTTPAAVTPAGSYSVNVTGTSTTSGSTSSSSTITVGFSVNVG